MIGVSQLALSCVLSSLLDLRMIIGYRRTLKLSFTTSPQGVPILDHVTARRLFAVAMNQRRLRNHDARGPFIFPHTKELETEEKTSALYAKRTQHESRYTKDIMGFWGF